MALAQVGDAIRSARRRLGWSRETLAHHSGLSWAAIAQIESGRRQDVRLSSLLALADALEVSLDWLGRGGAGADRALLRHRALTFSSDEMWLDMAVPYVSEGLEGGEPVLVITTSGHIAALQRALGSDAGQVDFRDSSLWYRSPQAAMNDLRLFLVESRASRAPWMRALGEPVWSGRSPAEIAGWIRYESFVNVALASVPATLVCPYDTRTAGALALGSVEHTHPELVGPDGPVPCAGYREPADLLLDG